MKLPWQETKPQCQVVIKLPADPGEDYDRVAECELRLSRLLTRGEVDLREVGGGVVGLFILTSEPEACVREALGHLSSMRVQPVAAGFRTAPDQAFLRLWPAPDSSPVEMS